MTAPVRARRRRREQERLTRQLPVAVDLIGVAVAAGYTPYLAVDLAVDWSPPAVAGATDARRTARRTSV